MGEARAASILADGMPPSREFRLGCSRVSTVATRVAVYITFYIPLVQYYLSYCTRHVSPMVDGRIHLHYYLCKRADRQWWYKPPASLPFFPCFPPSSTCPAAPGHRLGLLASLASLPTPMPENWLAWPVRSLHSMARRHHQPHSSVLRHGHREKSYLRDDVKTPDSHA